MRVSYDTNDGILQTALRVSSTIIPMVIDGAEFWGLLFLNLLLCTVKHQGLFDPQEHQVDIPFGLTGVTGGLMTFFVCFYNSHIFARYNSLYDLTQNMSEACLLVASIMKVNFPSRALQRKVTRLTLASCILFFFERTRSKDASCEEFSLSSTEYDQLLKMELLDAQEIRSLRTYCGSLGGDALPSLLVLRWSMELARLSLPEPEPRDDLTATLYDALYQVRDCQAHIVQITEMPMPFQYFHIMNLMLILNLLFWAYSLGCEDSYFSPLIYMFVQMMYQGVRELSAALSDPFGDDEVDFPIDEWIIRLYGRVCGVLEDTYQVSRMCVDGSTHLQAPRLAHRRINMFIDFGTEGSRYQHSPGQKLWQPWSRDRRVAAERLWGYRSHRRHHPRERQPLLAREAEQFESELEKRRAEWGWSADGSNGNGSSETNEQV